MKCMFSLSLVVWLHVKFTVLMTVNLNIFAVDLVLRILRIISNRKIKAMEIWQFHRTLGLVFREIKNPHLLSFV